MLVVRPLPASLSDEMTDDNGMIHYCW